MLTQVHQLGIRWEVARRYSEFHRFHELLSFLPPAHELLSEQAIATLPLPPGKRWGDYCYLLLPGLLTKWYPQYMAQLLADWKRLGLQVGFSPPHLTLPYRLYPGPS